MNIKYVKWYKQDSLELLADRILNTYHCEVPVDIDYIVEMMGLEICDIERLKEDFGLYGCLGQIKKKFVIFVQKGDLKLTNYYTNSTIAEELSHYILHKEYFKNVKDLNEAFEFYAKICKTSEMKMELDAKYLASAILVPREHVKKRALDAFKENETAIIEILKKDKEDICEAVINSLSASLSDVYRAPDGTIAYRLKTKSVGFKEFVKKKQKSLCE